MENENLQFFHCCGAEHTNSYQSLKEQDREPGKGSLKTSMSMLQCSKTLYWADIFP
jgi:hypothetical protein